MEKKYLLLILNFLFLSIFAQEKQTGIDKIIKSETAKYLSLKDFNENPNTANYNLTYVRLDLDLDPAIYFVSGTATSHFIPNAQMSSIYFDMETALKVSSVKYHGQNLSFQSLSTDELKIDFPTNLPANVVDSLSISYSGTPDASPGIQSFNVAPQSDGTPLLYTISEPYGSKYWWPTKQSLSDKIEKFDIKITCPNQYNVGSNGKLISETALPNNKKLTFWQTNYPMAAYLTAIAISNYQVLNSTIGLEPKFPFTNYIFPASATSANIANINATDATMQLFEQYFGPYPFRNEKYGHMQFAWGGGMENQTMTSLISWDKSLIAHELAHQWFGDKVTCKSWNDIWLNESFATFGANLTNEKLLMTATQFQNFLSTEINSITSLPNGSVYVSDAGLNDNDVWTIFDNRLTYSKGAYVLRMIRWIMGDDQFFQALKEYNSDPNLAYNYANSDNLKAHFNSVSGKDFTSFFNEWLYGQGFPTYNIKWNQTANNQLIFKIAQTQSDASVSFFELPLPIKVTGTSGQIAYLALDNTNNNQVITNNTVGFTVASVSFNYNLQILTKNAVVTKDTTLLLTSDSDKISTIKIYPNPVKDNLKISGLNAAENFEIYSIDGKKVKSGSYSPNSNLTISNLAKGVYILKIAGQNFKFIKE